MEKVKMLAIGTSSNRVSINLALAEAAAGMVAGAEVELLNVADYELPLFSDAREEELGQPELARQFIGKIAAADAVVISFAEYNGTYTASFKNIFDWASRVRKEVFQGKAAVFLSASQGRGGAQSVLQQALGSARFWGAKVIGSLSVPRFSENFDARSGKLIDITLRNSLDRVMQELLVEITRHQSRDAIAKRNLEGQPRVLEGRYETIG